MLTTRPATDLDDAFLCELYGSTRVEELALVDWNDEQKEAFIRMQFDARARSYAASFPQAEQNIVLADGIEVGAWIIDRGMAGIRVVDVAILPACRNQGYGTELMTRIQEEGRTSSRVVSLSVDRGAPAQRLYARMGFTVEDLADPVRFGLKWTPQQMPQATEVAP